MRRIERKTPLIEHTNKDEHQFKQDFQEDNENIDPELFRLEKSFSIWMERTFPSVESISFEDKLLKMELAIRTNVKARLKAEAEERHQTIREQVTTEIQYIIKLARYAENESKKHRDKLENMQKELEELNRVKADLIRKMDSNSGVPIE
ncbi:hypothetical protein HK096_009796 [Nowakowskiella sp. JEL0078]|nr:hypothetical protein HK096_009796 [Nowakowskiella sp. JEL0078]